MADLLPPLCPACDDRPAERRRIHAGEDSGPLDSLPLGMCSTCFDALYSGEVALGEDLARALVQSRVRLPPTAQWQSGTRHHGYLVVEIPGLLIEIWGAHAASQVAWEIRQMGDNRVLATGIAGDVRRAVRVLEAVIPAVENGL